MTDGDHMNEAGRGEFVTYREHITAKEEAAKVLSAIQLEQAAQRAALMHLPEDVRRLTDAVNALGNRTTAPVTPDHNALAMHNLASEMKALVVAQAAAQAARPNLAAEMAHAINTSKAGRAGSAWPWAITGACVALVVVFGLRQFTG